MDDYNDILTVSTIELHVPTQLCNGHICVGGAKRMSAQMQSSPMVARNQMISLVQVVRNASQQQVDHL